MKRLQWLWLVPLALGAAVAVAQLRQPDIVNHNLPPGLRPPAASFGPDGGIVFPLNQTGLEGAVQQSMPQLQECANLSPELYGHASLKLRVTAVDAGDQAEVEEVQVEGGTRLDHFEACALSVLSALRFEPPMEGDSVVITYPLDFAPPPDGGP